MVSAVSRTTIPAGRSGWRVTGYDRVRAMLEDTRLDLNPDPALAAQWFQDSPLHRVLVRMGSAPRANGGSDRPERALRTGTLTRMFSVQQLQRIRPGLQAYAEELLDAMTAGPGPADLTSGFSIPFCSRAACDLLGLPPSDMDKVIGWAGVDGDLDMRASLLGLRRLTTYVNELIADRRAHPRGDTVSDLVAADLFDEAHKGMLPNILTFILGQGWQLPAAAIDHGVLLLTGHPEQLARFRADPAGHPAAVEEVLRLFSSVSRRIGGVDRYANTDLELDGCRISAGDLVVLDLRSANRDVRVFAEPEQFDVTRSPNPHITFGHGFWYCNFNKVARVELEIALETVFRRLPGLRVAVDRNELEYRDLPESGVVRLPVAW
jgi:cytochrome P450